jgi:uncharacterized protein YciI
VDTSENKKAMKQITFYFRELVSVFLLLIILCPALVAQEDAASAYMSYDSITATKLGADEYGMRKYVMAFLKAGPNRDRSPEESATLQKAHMENIGRLAEAGKLVLAGPFLDNGELRGIYIFNVETIEEAEALTNTDPAVMAGSLVMELKPWYGSAALMMVNEIHGTLSKKPVTD